MRILFLVLLIFFTNSYAQEQKKIAYLNADISIPFWETMANGIKQEAKKHNYKVDIYNSNHSAKEELINLSKILKSNYSALITSPTNSSNAVTILKMAKKKNLPVVIADIGSESGEYLSYISSNNYKGAYEVGKTLVKELKNQKADVGIIAIPQTRENGKQRTKGFLDALEGSNIKSIGIKQLTKWDDKESYQFASDFIKNNKNLKAIWVQTSNTYKGILQAIKDQKKEREILLFAFDAELEFLELIKQRKIIATGMQQPFFIGQKALITSHKHIMGKKVDKNIQADILLVSSQNIEEKETDN